MIVVTRLDGRAFALNPDLIERIFESPDTTVVMADGANYIVTEPMAAVIDLIAAYRARVIALARSYAGHGDDGIFGADSAASIPAHAPRLSIIHPNDSTHPADPAGTSAAGE